MTTVYFIRHAEPDYTNHDDTLRPLTEKGMKDRKLVTAFLQDKDIDIVLSSPFLRARQTVEDFAQSKGLETGIVNDFRERKIDEGWIEDFRTFSKKQWADFNYKLDGECLREVQDRNIRALMEVLGKYRDKNIIVGSHGTALSTICNYFDRSYGYEDFEKIRGLMPWIVKFTFDGSRFVGMEKIDVFEVSGILKEK